MFLVLWVIGYVTVNLCVCVWMHSLTVFKEQHPFWGLQQAVFMADWAKCHSRKQNECVINPQGR